MKTETTGCIKRRTDDRVLLGERMRSCLEQNMAVFKAVAKQSRVPLSVINRAYAGLTLSRLEWRRLAELFHIPH